MIAFPQDHLKKKKKKKQSPEHYGSHSPFPVSLFLKSLNNVKPLKPEPGHISVRPGVQQIAAEYGSPGEVRKPSQKPPAWSPLHASHLPQQLVIVAVVGRLERRDWRTITQSGDTGGFIVTRSIIRPMIITGSINFRLQSDCPTSAAMT